MPSYTVEVEVPTENRDAIMKLFERVSDAAHEWGEQVGIDPSVSGRQTQPYYLRDVLVETITHHWPTPTSGCTCGWARLGRSFPGHVADVYEDAIKSLTDEEIS